MKRYRVRYRGSVEVIGCTYVDAKDREEAVDLAIEIPNSFINTVYMGPEHFGEILSVEEAEDDE